MNKSRRKNNKRLLGALLSLVMATTMLPATTLSANAASTNVDSVEEMVASMSLRDKVTQMMMVDFRYWDEDTTDDVDKTAFTVMNDQVRTIVEDYNFGAVVYFAQNITETEQAYELTMEMQKAATKDGGIAMIIAADQEGGSVYRLGSGTALPGNMALGATYASNGTTYAYEAGRIIGSEVSSLGINTTLAPVVDVNNNPNNPVIGLRSYSDDAFMVGELASATIQGMNKYNVIGCAKHFPGHGDTATDSHYGLPKVDKSLEELKDVELKPYEIAIQQGIDMIMTAHILYPQLENDTIVSEKTGNAESLPATMSDDIITGLLKEDMGFEGIVVTDAMNMAGISDNWNQVQSVEIAISAGVDMICMPCHLYSREDLADLDAIISGVMDAVEAGEIPESRIDDAVTRILTVKEKHGLLTWSEDDYSVEKALDTVGSDENREMEREIAAAAVTVVRNNNDVLPLDITSDSKVLMLVPYNNERAQVLMAWNRAKEAGIIPEGAQVDYFRFSSATISEELQKKLDWADTYIIISEVSSAARMGYKYWLSAMPNQLCNYADENGKTAIIASCDKPYDVQLYPKADAILAAYGCKGSAVDPTEALVGGVTTSEAAYGPNIIAAVEVALGTYPAQGKLPVAIPIYNTETNAYKSEILYERGYGLTYYAAVTCSDDHKYGSPEVISEVTCDTDGVVETQCGICGYIHKEVTPAKGHEFVTEVQEATCTEEGYELYSCKNCDEVGANYSEALGHAYSEDWTVDKKATCLETGSKSRHCTRTGCDATTDTTVVEKTAHRYDNGKITTEATPVTDGVITYTCEVCKGKKTEIFVYDGMSVERICGDDRYQTAYAIADKLKEELEIDKFSTVIVTDGTNFPDALAGSYLAAKKSAPILMVNGKATKTSDPTVQKLCTYIEENLASDGVVYLLGGSAAVPDFVDTIIKDAGYTVKRLSGETRYETNLLILDEAGVTEQDILVCTGTGFADSLSASATGLPVLLVGDSLTNEQKKFLKEAKANNFYIVGGTAVINETVEKAIGKYGTTQRISGQLRYDTSVELAKTFFPDAKAAVISYAWGFPDGLCGGPLAYNMGVPLILTGADMANGFDEAAQQAASKTAVEYIKNHKIKAGTVLGGTSVLPDYTINLIFDMDMNE